MTPLILAAEKLTIDDVLLLQHTYPHRDAIDGVTIFLPDWEEDPSLLFRLYVVTLDLGGTAAHVGVTAAPAPHQAPTINELTIAAAAALATKAALSGVTDDEQEADLLANGLSELTGREFCPFSYDGRAVLFEDFADGSSEITAEFDTWPELHAYLHGRIDQACPDEFGLPQPDAGDSSLRTEVRLQELAARLREVLAPEGANQADDRAVMPPSSDPQNP
jgi:hypothetical protein